MDITETQEEIDRLLRRALKAEAERDDYKACADKPMGRVMQIDGIALRAANRISHHWPDTIDDRAERQAIMDTQQVVACSIEEALAPIEAERDAALEREQALAARMERLTALARELDDVIPATSYSPISCAKGEYLERLDQALSEIPLTSLARRDLMKQAEALDDAAEGFEIVGKRTHADAAQALRLSATELRRQSERGD